MFGPLPALFSWAYCSSERDQMVADRKQSSLLPFPCTSPLRKNGGKVLSILPVEIYHEILVYYLGDEDSLTEAERAQIYSNLMLVCKLFYSMFLPRRLHSITLTGSQNMKTIVNFAKHKSWPYYKSYALVKHLTLSDWIPPRCYDSCDNEEVEEDDITERWMFRGVLGRIRNSFWRLVNIQSLTLDSVPIDPEFLTGIVTDLVSLEVVKITKCYFEESESSSTSEYQPLTRWTEFHFSRNKDYSPWLPSLASWSASPALTSFSTSEWDVTHVVLSSPIQFSALTHLSTPCQNSFFLSTFLQSTPSIVSLSINPQPVPFTETGDSEFAVVQEGFDLAVDALPNLLSLRCPSVYLPGLISGRPVEHVDLPGFTYFQESATEEDGETLADFYWETVDTLDTLRRSRSPIRRLCAFSYTLQQMISSRGRYDSANGHAQVLKNIEELTIYLHTATVYAVCIILQACPYPVAPNARTVHVKDATGTSYPPRVVIDLPCEYSYVVMYFAKSFSRATRISLSEHIEWRRSEGAGATHWTPAVINRPSTRTYLLKIARTEIRVVNDWNGCFIGLFDETELTRQMRRMFMLQPLEPPSVYNFGLLR